MNSNSRLALGAAIMLSAILASAVAGRILWTGPGGRGTQRTSGTSGPAPPGEAPGAERLSSGVKEEPPEFDPIRRLGWRVWGKVTDPLRVPLSGARVVLRYFDGQSYQAWTGPFPTDEKGRYAAFIPAEPSVRLFPPDAILPMEILGHAAAGRHRPNDDFLADLPHPDHSGEPLRLDIVLKSGALLEGVLEGPEGASVADASIFKLHAGRNWKEAARTGPDGAFFLPIDEAGRISLFAMKRDQGAAPPVFVEADPASDVRAPDLLLGEYGSIEGAACLPDGEPAGGVEIVALHENLHGRASQEGDPADVCDRILRIEHIPLDTGAFKGLPFGSAVTDGEGRFRMKGLKPGRYALWAPRPLSIDGRAPAGPEVLMQETNGLDARLTIAGHRIRIILRDARGYRIPVAALTLESDALRETERVVRGLLERWIQPGKYRLTATTKDGLFAEKEIRVEEGDHAFVQELVLGDPLPKGRLRLRIQDQQGDAPEPLPGLTLLLTGRLDGLQMDLAGIEGEDQGAFDLSVPPDRYDLVLLPEVSADHMYLPVSIPGVVVEAGRTAEVPVRLRQGGRLRLRLRPAVESGGPPYSRIEAVHKETGATEPLLFFFPEGRAPAVPALGIRFGPSYLAAKIFEAGSYVIQVVDGDKVLVRTDCRIRSGTVTDVECVFAGK